MNTTSYARFDNRAKRFFETTLYACTDLQKPDQNTLRHVVLSEIKRSLPILTDENMARLSKTFDFSFETHDTPKPRDSGEAYIFHPVRACLVLAWMQSIFRICDVESIVQTLLHDCFEEVDGTTLNRLLFRTNMALVFGDETAYGVHCLTKHKERGETNSAYCMRLTRCDVWRPLAAKFADRIDNVWTIDAVSIERRTRKLDETKMWFPRIGERFEHLIIMGTKSQTLTPSESWMNFCHCMQGYLRYALRQKGA